MKKYIKYLGFLAVFVSSAFAADSLSPPKASVDIDAVDAMYGVYVEAMAGLGFRNMTQDSPLSAEMRYQNITLDPDVQSSWSHGSWSWAAGLDATYSLTPVFSVESGFMLLGDQTFKIDSGTGATDSNSFSLGGKWYGSGSKIQFSSWFMYGGVRGDWAIIKNWSAFMKVSLAYVGTDIKIHRVTDSSTLSESASSNHWAPVFAVGVNYAFAHSWRASLGYWLLLSESHISQDHLFSYQDSGSLHKIDMPVWHALIMSLGYRFSF